MDDGEFYNPALPYNFSQSTFTPAEFYSSDSGGEPSAGMADVFSTLGDTYAGDECDGGITLPPTRRQLQEMLLLPPPTPPSLVTTTTSDDEPHLGFIDGAIRHSTDANVTKAVEVETVDASAAGIHESPYQVNKGDSMTPPEAGIARDIVTSRDTVTSLDTVTAHDVTARDTATSRKNELLSTVGELRHVKDQLRLPLTSLAVQASE